MITIREIADDDTRISSTRWAFASTIVFDMLVIVATIAAYIVCHLLNKPIDISFLYAVVAMMGVLTTITGTTKALQGFERGKESEKPASPEKKRLKESLDSEEDLDCEK